MIKSHFNPERPIQTQQTPNNPNQTRQESHFHYLKTRLVNYLSDNAIKPSPALKKEIIESKHLLVLRLLDSIKEIKLGFSKEVSSKRAEAIKREGDYIKLHLEEDNLPVALSGATNTLAQTNYRLAIEILRSYSLIQQGSKLPEQMKERWIGAAKLALNDDLNQVEDLHGKLSEQRNHLMKLIRDVGKYKSCVAPSIYSDLLTDINNLMSDLYKCTLEMQVMVLFDEQAKASRAMQSIEPPREVPSQLTTPSQPVRTPLEPPKLQRTHRLAPGTILNIPQITQTAGDVPLQNIAAAGPNRVGPAGFFYPLQAGILAQQNQVIAPSILHETTLVAFMPEKVLEKALQPPYHPFFKGLDDSSREQVIAIAKEIISACKQELTKPHFTGRLLSRGCP